jgi:allophanate hydrolase
VTPHLHVVDPGFRTTIQDSGRPGFQSQGVPVSGALDATALAAANLVAGNPAAAAGLEITATGPVLVVAAEAVRIAVAGSGMAIVIDGRPAVPPLVSVTLVRGQRFCVMAPRTSAVGYLAVAGGIAVPVVLGSRSTCPRARLGGLDGRGLAAGDRLPLGADQPPSGPDRRGPALDLSPPAVLRVLLSEPGRDFADAVRTAFVAARYTVTPAVDRMGLRLSGPPLLSLCPGESLSEGLAPGAIQVPGDGQPILLLADRQTTGGYPRIAHVIAADLPAAGRLRPGHTVAFRPTTLDEADRARRALKASLAAFAAAIAPLMADGLDTGTLLAENLVSGVTGGDDPA